MMTDLSDLKYGLPNNKKIFIKDTDFNDIPDRVRDKLKDTEILIFSYMNNVLGYTVNIKVNIEGNIIGEENNKSWILNDLNLYHFLAGNTELISEINHVPEYIIQDLFDSYVQPLAEKIANVYNVFTNLMCINDFKVYIEDTHIKLCSDSGRRSAVISYDGSVIYVNMYTTDIRKTMQFNDYITLIRELRKFLFHDTCKVEIKNLAGLEKVLISIMSKRYNPVEEFITMYKDIDEFPELALNVVKFIKNTILPYDINESAVTDFRKSIYKQYNKNFDIIKKYFKLGITEFFDISVAGIDRGLNVYPAVVLLITNDHMSTHTVKLYMDDDFNINVSSTSFEGNVDEEEIISAVVSRVLRNHLKDMYFYLKIRNLFITKTDSKAFEMISKAIWYVETDASSDKRISRDALLKAFNETGITEGIDKIIENYRRN